MKTAILYTGGKDSSFSLYWALLQGFSVEALLSVIPTYDYSMLYHRPLLEILEAQSSCLGIPLVYEYVYREGEELDVLAELIGRAKKEYGISAVFSGALLSDFQRIRYSMIAEEVGVKTYTPLWRIDQSRYMYDLVNEGFEIVIISINTYGLPSKYLGKTLTLKDVLEIISLAEKYGFNPAFEGGEAETVVVYMPFYKCRLGIRGEVLEKGPYEYVYSIRGIEVIPL